MSEPTWIKSEIIDSGNYPKTSFVGVLKAIYPSTTDDGTPTLQLDFEDGKTYRMFTAAKDYGVHEDGTVDGFLAIGKFLASIERLDAKTGLPTDDSTAQKIQTFWAMLDGLPTGFKTEPDIVGHKIHNVAALRQIGDTEQTSKYPDWTISQVEGLGTTPASAPKTKAGPSTRQKPGKLPPEPKTSGPATTPELTNALLDIMIEPHSIKEAYLSLGKKYTPSEIKNSLEALKAEGKVIEDTNKFQVV